MALEALKRYAEQEPTKTPERPRPAATKTHQEQYKNELAAMADKIRDSETIKTRITKGIQRGEPLEDLFILALECIGKITDDTVFINLSTKDFKEKYQPKQIEIGT